MSRDCGTAKQARDFGYGQPCALGGTPFDGLMLIGANQEHGFLAASDGSVRDDLADCFEMIAIAGMGFVYRFGRNLIARDMEISPERKGQPSPDTPPKPSSMGPALAIVVFLFGAFILVISFSSAWDMLAHGGTVMDGATYRNAGRLPRSEAVTRTGTPFMYWALVLIKLALSWFSLLLMLAGVVGMARSGADDGGNDGDTST